MPSPLHPYQLSSSHSSSTASTRALQHRKSSAEKAGFVHRTSSSSSLHRAASNKSNSSMGQSSKLAPKHHHHHAHVAHTSASKHHRTTSFGYRVPSYGKGLNKLTALTTVKTDDGPKEHLSIHSLVDRAGGASMQRSLSEGNALARKERRPSSSSIHSARPKVRRPVSQPQAQPSSVKNDKQHILFSTRHSSEDEDEDTTHLVHRKCTEIVQSPQLHPELQRHLPGISPSTIVHPPPQPKSGLREGLASSAPRFLQKSLSQVALVPPKVSHTNAISKDLAKPSTSVEHTYTENPSSTGSEPQIPPSSNPISRFISSTPPSRTPRTPDIEISSSSGLRRNQSSTSLATDNTIPLTSASQGKLTRTQQKLLLQRASTQPLNLAAPTTYAASPSLQQVQHMESTSADYFSPLPSTPGLAPVTQGVPPNIPYDVKVAREFDRISRELINARRFGDPTADAITRFQQRTSTAPVSSTPKQSLSKKGSAFGLSMSWKRSPDKNDGADGGNRARVDVEEDDMFGRDMRRTRVRDLMRQMWFDEVDVEGMGDEDERERHEEVSLGRRKVRRAGART